MSKLLKVVLFEGVLRTVLPDGSFLPKEIETIIISSAGDVEGTAIAKVSFIIDISELGKSDIFDPKGEDLKEILLTNTNTYIEKDVK